MEIQANPPAAWRGLARAVAALVLLVGVSCGGAQRESSSTSSLRGSGAPLDWTLGTPDGQVISAASRLGRPTVLFFFTTYDAPSQVVALRLDQLRHQAKRRFDVVGVALEPPNHASLVAVFGESLQLGFPLVMADPALLAGQGAFGDVRQVPGFVLVDADAREVLRGSGVPGLTALFEQLDASHQAR